LGGVHLGLQPVIAKHKIRRRRCSGHSRDRGRKRGRSVRLYGGRNVFLKEAEACPICSQEAPTGRGGRARTKTDSQSGEKWPKFSGLVLDRPSATSFPSRRDPGPQVRRRGQIRSVPAVGVWEEWQFLNCGELYGGKIKEGMRRERKNSRPAVR